LGMQKEITKKCSDKNRKERSNYQMGMLQ